MPDSQDSDSRSGVTFAATVDESKRKAVERLFFFHPRQSDYIEAIRETIEATGLPRLAQASGRISVEVPSGAFQCLFAIDESTSDPVGVALYCRPDPTTLWIAHLATIPDDLSVTGEASIPGMLVGKLAEIARAIRGVKRIQLPYRHERYIRLR